MSTALRGRINLGVMAPEPRTSFEAAEAGLEVARRYGLRGYIRTLVGNLAGAALEVGEWDRAIHELTVARDESPDELAANHASWALFNFTAWRGDDVTAEIARLTAWAESFDEAGAREAVHDLRAQVAYASGDLRVACDEWMAFAPSDALNAPPACLGAGLAALMAADAVRASAALAAHEATARHGRLFSLDRRLIRAGLLGLDDRPAEAIREVRAILEEYDRLGLPWRQALGALMLVSVVGAGTTEIREMADAAREIFTRLGAKPFLARLDAALAHPPDRTGPVRVTV